MTGSSREYHCPQCDYDLRGQTVERCPECGFHYDLPALRSLAWQAFVAACDPYLQAAKILAPAGLLGIGAILAPGPRPNAGLILAYIPIGILFLVSSRMVESYVMGTLRHESHDAEWLEGSTRASLAGLLVFLSLVLPGRGRQIVLAPYVAPVLILGGIVWALWGLFKQRPALLLSATPAQKAVLERAHQTVWSLTIADALILLLLVVLKL